MSDDALTDKGRLLFAAGFVFGVTVTLLVLAVVTVTVIAEPAHEILLTDAVITIAGGIFFTGVVGVGLYLLAFPTNHLDLPAGPLFGEDDGH